jgi:hypothetical protein
MKKPLAQVEVLMLFHPSMQTGGPHKVQPDEVVRATQGWLTVDVHGKRGISELTGRPILEDMRLETGGEDIEALLPSNMVEEIQTYTLEVA